MSNTNEDAWLNLKETAAYLKVSKSWIYQVGNRLDFPKHKIGTTYRYKKSELDTWMKAQSQDSE